MLVAFPPSYLGAAAEVVKKYSTYVSMIYFVVFANDSKFQSIKKNERDTTFMISHPIKVFMNLSSKWAFNSDKIKSM